MKLHSLLTVAFIAFGTVVASGQVATGTPPFGSFGGGPFDTVNLGNLNVHFVVPVLNKAGRGAPFSYNLSYDSSVWTPVNSSGITQWQPASNWGWTSSYEGAFGYVSQTSGMVSSNCLLESGKTEPYTYSYWWTYGYGDRLGVFHPAYIATYLLSPAARLCGITGSLTGSAVASDGSGYTLSADEGAVTVTSRSGHVIVPPINGVPSSTSFTDTNGNEITATGGTQFFDTLSSTTPVITISSPAPPSPATFTYTAPTGSSVSYTMNYTQYTVKTDYGIAGINEYGPLSNSLVSSITLPDTSSYSFTYEKTPGSCTPLSGTYSTNCVTGRIASVTLPTGGSIAYTYSGGSSGIESDGSTAGLTRTLTPGGEWQYARTQVSGNHWQTQITSPPDTQNPSNASDVTVMDFQEYSTNFYETQQLSYQAGTSGTLLSTTIICYNGNGVTTPSSCPTTAITSQILRTTVFKQLPNASGLQSETDSTVNPYGLQSEVDDYGYGSGAVGSLIRKTITSYASLGNGIVDHKATVTVEDSGNNIKASTTYSYDAGTPTTTTGTPQHVAVTGSRGLLTSVAAQANGTTTLYRAYTYYDTGNLETSTDVSTSSTTSCTSNPSSCTTYNYSSSGSCGNSFVTSITEPLNLSRSMTWNCTGGVLLSLTDENGNTSSTAYSGSNYSNAFWQPYSTTDEALNTTNYFYSLNPSNQQFQIESKYASAFNSGASIVDIVTTNDGFGRTIFRQTKQGPSAGNYDTVASCYDSFGRKDGVTLPYSATVETSNIQSCSGAQTDYAYDALNRTTSVSDSGGGLTTYAYNENDVLQTLTSPTQSKQREYDGLGRLTSVCEVTSGTTAFPSASCAQNTSATGYLTQYAYDLLDDRTGVTQNAQASSGHQTRAYVFDMLGRLTSETNPEMNNSAVTYTYDSLSSDASCGTITSAGNIVKRLDATGINATCYGGYDAYHRVGTIIYPSTTTPAKNFVYDTATVNGTSMANAKTHLAEAYTCTGTCTGKITDLGFSYSVTGQTSGVWELTPNSGANTYYQVSSIYWPNGAINTLSNLSGLPTITYSTDGEGRMSTVTSGSNNSPLIAAISYDPSSHVTGLTFGSSDNDAFVFDPNTGRMTKYTYSVGSSPQTDIGQLTWNPNGSLGQLAITDQLNTADSQTCTYTHDALGRVASANCGASTWSQTFSYDPFGNIMKTVPGGSTGTAFQPSYDYTNYTNRITSSPFTYNNNNGDMTADNSHTYSWDTENKLTGIDSGTSNGICQVYDALGRVVEQDMGSTCTSSSTEIVYAPSGAKLALMNGTTLKKAFAPLPGGAQAVYNSSGLQYYRHPDWLGSSRLASASSSRSLYYSGAYAPFGENYVPAGTQDLVFTGQNQDKESSAAGGVGGLYDFLYREHSPVQGRWLSPDPAGLLAVNASDPQSWNRYAYVGNRPLNTIDSLGLDVYECLIDDVESCSDGDDGPGGDDPVCLGLNEELCNPLLFFGYSPDGSGTDGGGTGFASGDEGPGLSGLNTAALSFSSLLGLVPGTQCGDFTACGSLGPGPFSVASDGAIPWESELTLPTWLTRFGGIIPILLYLVQQQSDAGPPDPNKFVMCWDPVKVSGGETICEYKCADGQNRYLYFWSKTVACPDPYWFLKD